MKLVDANVLITAVNTEADAHREAKLWLDRALSGRSSVAFAWNPLLAFVRITTNERFFPRPLTTAQAMSIVDAWTTHPGARILQPTTRHATVLAELLAIAPGVSNLVNDAHIAALAIEHRATIVSYDGDFARFPGITWEHPSTR